MSAQPPAPQLQGAVPHLPRGNGTQEGRSRQHPVGQDPSPGEHAGATLSPHRPDCVRVRLCAYVRHPFTRPFTHLTLAHRTRVAVDTGPRKTRREEGGTPTWAIMEGFLEVVSAWAQPWRSLRGWEGLWGQGLEGSRQGAAPSAIRAGGMVGCSLGNQCMWG